MSDREAADVEMEQKADVEITHAFEGKMKLWCGVYGEVIFFDVEVGRNANVGELKKAIVDEMKDVNDQFKVHPAKLTLRLARKNGHWLQEDETEALLRGPANLEFEKMYTSWKLSKYFTSGMDLGEEVIHVLVELPEAFPPTKRARLDEAISLVNESLEIKTLEDVPQIEIKRETKYVTLPAAFVKACGLASGRDMMLYCRPQVHELWEFLEKEVIGENAKGYIVGPPGTGKSLCTLSFVASLNFEEWNVVWIHLSREWSPVCVALGRKQFWRFNRTTFTAPRVDNKKLFLCVDGLTHSENDKSFLSDVHASLGDEDRLVLCSSMATLGKRKIDDDDAANMKEFMMYSWTIGEYLAAIDNQSFYDKVADKFDASSDSKVNVEDHEVESEPNTKKYALGLKFYYAGGSCRYMFQYPTQKVRTELERAIQSDADKSQLVKYCSGVLHKDSVNSLYGMQRDGPDSGRFPVSSYVVSRFAEECSEDTIADLAKRLNASHNPALDGHLFEWLFLAYVARRRVKLFDGNVEDVLPQARVERFDPKKQFQRYNKKEAYRGVISCCHVEDGTYDIDFRDGEKDTDVDAEQILLQNSSADQKQLAFNVGDKVKAKQKLRIRGNQSWLQPVAWNQGGYDAVYFDLDKNEVIFVQVTRATTHDFKMVYFNEVLLKLKSAGMHISKVVVYFVIKPTQRVGDFKFGIIEDRDLLAKFDASWTRPEEEHVKVRCLETNSV